MANDALYDSFGTYEFCKRVLTAEAESSHQEAAKILFCGGIAGMATWASVFPLDVIKTRLQAQTTPGSSLQSQSSPDRQPLIRPTGNAERILSTVEVAKQAFRSEGLSVFYRGLGVCSLRAFIVNAVQVCGHNSPSVGSHALTSVVGDVRVDNESSQQLRDDIVYISHMSRKEKTDGC